MKVSTILDQIDLGSIALPEFQRGYVWNRDQVRGLIDSLYRRHPVGGLLVWVTKTENPDVSARGGAALAAGTVKLLLDGQQRITSLYGLIRGKPPQFFQGNVDAFTGLYFHLDEETFKFYAPLEMKGNSAWISITELMQKGLAAFVPQLPPEKLGTYINRLNAIASIQEIDFHIEEVTGEDKTIDVVVEIFNKVNSGGTKLSKGDLALAKVCAEWAAAREQLRARLKGWAKAGFDFELEWLLRNITTVVTGQSLFSGLEKVDAPSFKAGLNQAEQAIDYLLNTISARLGLDYDRVLGGRYSFPVMARYVALHGGKIKDSAERDKILYWYIHAFLWGRFAGATETALNQDLRVIDTDPSSLDRLIEQLRRWRGELRVRPENFSGMGLGARFYPLLYLLTRVDGSRDWGTGLPLTAHLLGKLSSLQVHHIFPKALLYKHGYNRGEVNALSNFCFLTQDTNLDISSKAPAVYFPGIEDHHPGALASQWVPLDPELWKVENYPAFLVARQQLLADAANTFLDSLIAGTRATMPAEWPAPVPSPISAASVPGGISSDEEEQVLRATNEWVEAQGLPAGVLLYEVVELETGTPLAVLDLAWPKGLQEGYSSPAALLLNEDQATEEAANRAGYRFFTSVPTFREYVEREILSLPAGVGIP